MGEISDALKRARPVETTRPERAAKVPSTYRDALRDEPLEPRPEPGPPIAIPVDPPQGEHHGRTVLLEPGGAVSERYRHFAIRLNRAAKAAGARTVVVTSASRGEGKTTPSCNLALALSSMAGGRKIGLFEMDLRRPALGPELGIEPRVGIESVLAGEARLDEACITTNLPDLDVYLAKQPRLDALELISGPSFGATLKELARRYDLVVVDAPPVLPVPDVPLLMRHADAAVLVARMGQTRRGTFEETLALVERDKVLGTFVNEAEPPRHSKYYGHYTYESSEGDEGQEASR